MAIRNWPIWGAFARLLMDATLFSEVRKVFYVKVRTYSYVCMCGRSIIKRKENFMCSNFPHRSFRCVFFVYILNQPKNGELLDLLPARSLVFFGRPTFCKPIEYDTSTRIACIRLQSVDIFECLETDEVRGDYTYSIGRFIIVNVILT